MAINLNLDDDQDLTADAAQDLMPGNNAAVEADMKGGLDFATLDLMTNNGPRCPVVLVLDASGSMGGAPIQSLSGGLDALVREINKDELARDRVEVSIVVFGPDGVTPATPFVTMDNIVLPELVASGLTPMGEAVMTGVTAIRDRKKVLKEQGVKYYKPWLMVISDGLATDDLTQASTEVKAELSRNGLAFFGIGVGNGAEDAMNSLETISGQEALKLKGLAFDELFQWVSASQAAVSASTPGDKVALPTPSNWTEI